MKVLLSSDWARATIHYNNGTKLNLIADNKFDMMRLLILFGAYSTGV